MNTQESHRQLLEFVDPRKLQVKPSDFTPREYQVLEEVNRRVAAGENLQKIIDFLFETTRDIFPCDRIGLAFLQDNAQRVVAHIARADYEPLLLTKGYAQDLRGSSLAAVLKTNRVRIINDLEMYLHRKPHSESTALLVKEGVRSSMTCPLFVEQKPIGFLFRSSRQPYSYSHREAALHLAMAERLSQAVEKAYRIEELEAANRAYLEMLGFVSHELKSPLASIVMDARLLTDGYLGELNPKQHEKAKRIIQKVEYLLNLVREYLDLSRIESGHIRMIYQEVDFVKQVVEPSLEIIRPQIETKSIQIEQIVLPNSPKVECDPELMQIVMVNLIGNGVKYGYDNGKLRVTVGIKDTRLVVSVWNTGPGFPPEERQRLFRKFSRIPTPELMKQKGTGVGLYTTWQIIQRHNGKIHATSEPGKWAEFTFEIPLNQLLAENNSRKDGVHESDLSSNSPDRP